MAIATIPELEAELLEAVRGVPAFAASGFSVFNVDDFGVKSAGQGTSLPAFGVAYDGAEPTGNEVNPTGRGAGSALLHVQFVIVIAVQYGYTGSDDTKQQAFALLDQVRATVLGLKGVNSRPWRFVGERPEADASGDGVVFYSQVWQTTLPIVGNFNNL